MTYKTILLHLHDIGRADRLLQAAIPLARDMNAHLTALAVVPPYIVVPGDSGASVTIDEHRDVYRGDMVKLKQMFTETTAGQPLKAEWREADAGFFTVANIICDHGRCADLIIASQSDPKWVSSSLIEDPVHVAMDSGRPVVLIPNAGSTSLVPKRVTIAWNGRREAARAVFDAMPLLTAAKDVNVVWINPEKEQYLAGDLPAAEICAALARHGIKAQASQASATGSDFGPELLRQAKVFGSDLLVMGCYGHSRLREFILGGATRHVLGHMGLPVLLAH